MKHVKKAAKVQQWLTDQLESQLVFWLRFFSKPLEPKR